MIEWGEFHIIMSRAPATRILPKISPPHVALAPLHRLSAPSLSRAFPNDGAGATDGSPRPPEGISVAERRSDVTVLSVSFQGEGDRYVRRTLKIELGQ